jgi:hypothetical protein
MDRWTNGRTNGQMDGVSYRGATSHLKIVYVKNIFGSSWWDFDSQQVETLYNLDLAHSSCNHSKPFLLFEKLFLDLPVFFGLSVVKRTMSMMVNNCNQTKHV